MIKKLILGISTYQLTHDEKALLKESQPYGIILFKRNCKNPDQLIKLNKSIKEIIPNCLIFIDQEGGRVARLRKAEFIEFTSALVIIGNFTIRFLFLSYNTNIFSSDWNSALDILSTSPNDSTFPLLIIRFLINFKFISYVSNRPESFI